MASTALGDIPGNRFTIPCMTHASFASGGANARVGQAGPFPFPIRVRSAYWTATGADNTASSSVSYRRLTLVNGGTAGTGTVVAASLNLTATQASLLPRAMTIGAVGVATLAAGEVLVASQATVGGADANGTVLAAGQFAIDYEIL